MSFEDWARRRVSSPDSPKVRSTLATVVPAPTGQQGHPLPAPPVGYTWAHHPTQGIIAVPLQGPAPLPPRQPQAVTPYQQNVSPFVGGGRAPGSHVPSPVRTCELVKPGTRDTYAELLDSVPELYPSIDASNPAVAQELASLQSLPEYHDKGHVATDAGTAAYPTHGAHSPVAQVAPLK